MNKLILTAALLLAGTAASPAEAAKRIKPGVVSLDPKLGYLLVRAGPTLGKKGKIAPLHFWRYDVERRDIRFARKKDPNPVPKGEDASAWIGDRPFSTGVGASTFLVSLTPGEWVIHGTDTTCFCLGSYRFTVEPGAVTDIGTIITMRDDGSGEDPALKRHPVSQDIVTERQYLLNDQMLVRPAVDSDAVPREIAGFKVTRAELIPDARFLNRGNTRIGYVRGLLVNRAAGLDDPVTGDGAEVVAMVKQDGGEDGLKPKPVVDEPKQQETAAGQPAA